MPMSELTYWFVIVLLSCTLAGCVAPPTTPVGTLGTTVDLHQHLPPEVARQGVAGDRVQSYEAEMEIEDTGAMVRLHWHAFRNGRDAYLLSYAWEVVRSAPGVEVQDYPAAALDIAPFNSGTQDVVIQEIPISISWVRRSLLSVQGGAFQVTIAADGTWHGEP